MEVAVAMVMAVVAVATMAVVVVGEQAMVVVVGEQAALARQVEARGVHVQEEQQKWAPVAHAAKPVIDRTVLPV